MNPAKSRALYLHIPFCSAICCYCDFPKLLALDRYIEPYLAALKNELLTIDSQPLSTIYIGGGTPTVLTVSQLEDLLAFIAERFGKPAGEFSVETTPEALTPDKLDALLKAGVNRVSIGVQTFNRLPYLDRTADPAKLQELTALFTSRRFKEYSFDLIYGWPGTRAADALCDLRFLLDLCPSHLSCYPLQLEAGTRLAQLGLKMLSDDAVADQYEALVDALSAAGFERYEISNFARLGHESQHNMTYWRGGEYLAAGLGACSYVGGIRTTRTRSLTRYLSGDCQSEIEIESPAEIINDYVMLNLRLSRGFALADFKERFGCDFLALYQCEISRVQSDLLIAGGRVRVRPEKLYVLDSVLTELLK